MTMIIGSGLLATAMQTCFEQDDGAVVYAAGVSNSQCTDTKEFLREAVRLEQAIQTHSRADPFIYFSTCSIDDMDSLGTPYVRHKLAMEAMVRPLSGHLIVRLPQVAGYTPNPHTLLNFLYARIVRGEGFTIWTKARRNIIDCTDVARLVHAMSVDGCRGRTINIASSSDHSLVEIVRVFESILGKTAIVDFEDKGGSYPIDISEMAPYAIAEGIRFDEGYLERVLKKYYGQHRVH